MAVSPAILIKHRNPGPLGQVRDRRLCLEKSRECWSNGVMVYGSWAPREQNRFYPGFDSQQMFIMFSDFQYSNTPTLQSKVEISSVTERPLPGVEPKPGPLGPDLYSVTPNSLTLYLSSMRVLSRICLYFAKTSGLDRIGTCRWLNPHFKMASAWALGSN